MSGLTDLNALLRSMAPEASNETFVFVSLGHETIPPGLNPLGQFQEAEGLTLICSLDDALAHNLSFDSQYRRITLNVHSSLAAVGFLAALSQALAAENIPCNVVSAFYHDHLFIPASLTSKALQALQSLAENQPNV